MKIPRPAAAGVIALVLMAGLVSPVQAYPYCYGGHWGGCGGWYGSGIPNGLGWTLFGLGAAAAVATPVIAASYAAPVYAAPYPAYYYQGAPQAVNPQQSSQASQAASATPSCGALAKAQSKLAGLGYYHGPIDGSYGPKTAQAVQQFQADNNLSVTGRLDLKTLSELGITL